MIDTRIFELVERAFDYRGHVTVARRDGTTLVGFVYDRGAAHVEMFDEHAAHRVRIAIDDIADITLSGDDCAAKAQNNWERRRGGLDARGTSAWGNWEQRATLVVAALPIELRAIAAALGVRARGAAAAATIGDVRVIARAIGVGGGAAQVIAAERPRLVVSCGFAGALHPALGPGDIVLASSVRDDSGELAIAREAVLAEARRALAGTPRLSEGELLSTTRIATTASAKRALARPGRLAVDLESWAVARAATRAGVPWLALRVILDPLDVDLPRFAGEARTHYAAAALRHALGDPRGTRDVVRLARQAALALRSLRRAIEALAPVLGRIGVTEGRA